MMGALFFYPNQTFTILSDCKGPARTWNRITHSTGSSWSFFRFFGITCSLLLRFGLWKTARFSLIRPVCQQPYDGGRTYLALLLRLGLLFRSTVLIVDLGLLLSDLA
jgi:hypothetical protein